MLSKSSNWLEKIVDPLAHPIVSSLYRGREVENFYKRHPLVKGMDFIDDLFHDLSLSFTWSVRDKARIPSEGKLICVVNFPLGGLEVLAVSKAVSEVRKDIKVLANTPLLNLPELEDFAIPAALKDDSKIWTEEIWDDLDQEMVKESAVIVFPGKKPSHLTMLGIRDRKWDPMLVSAILRYDAMVLPIMVDAFNHPLHRLQAAIGHYTQDRALYDVFCRRQAKVNIMIGEPIPPASFQGLRARSTTKLLRKHLYLIPKKKKGLFKTIKNVIHPVDRKALRNEVFKGEMLGLTDDHKVILVIEAEKSSVTMQEIARLREVTFRLMNEGTGLNKDLDHFDHRYKHLVLWDDRELEIVGAYRLGVGREIIARHGIKGFYTNTLFKIDEEKESLLMDSIECGRSFIQKKYWNSMALDYLWHGIGAYLSKHSSVKYLFGPVSISPTYNTGAKDAIIYYYLKWHQDPAPWAIPAMPYILSSNKKKSLMNIFTGDTAREDLAILKKTLKFYGYSIPTLYKQYVDLCEPGGVTFHHFNVDPDFGHCVDGFIFLDISKIKEKKRQRYIENKSAKAVSGPSLSSYFEI